jgi:hypothetical protein
MEQVIRELKSEFVVLIDDFHYISRDTQAALANEMKEAARRGLKLIVAPVPHRASDVVRANADLKGRVASIDVPSGNTRISRRLGCRAFPSFE